MHLTNDLAMTQHHHVVDIHVGQRGDFVIEMIEQVCINSFGSRRTARQFTHLGNRSQGNSQE